MDTEDSENLSQFEGIRESGHCIFSIIRSLQSVDLLVPTRRTGRRGYAISVADLPDRIGVGKA